MGQLKYNNGTTWEPAVQGIGDYSVAVKGEVMGGVADGTNRTFTTTRDFQIKSLPDSHAIAVYKNGVRMTQAVDYNVTVAKTILFVTAPAAGALIVADYDTTSSYAINGALTGRRKENVSGTKDGVNKVFSTSGVYIGSTLEVYINGLYEGNMVTETNPTAKTFTLATAPLATDNIQVSYQTAVSASGNADTVDSYHAGGNAPNTLAILNADGKLPSSTLPVWKTWVPTFTGFSAVPTGAIYEYAEIGDIIHLKIRQTVAGTSNSGDFFITLPVQAALTENALSVVAVTNNGTGQAGVAIINGSITQNEVRLFSNLAGDAFTTSGGKRTSGLQMSYRRA